MLDCASKHELVQRSVFAAPSKAGTIYHGVIIFFIYFQESDVRQREVISIIIIIIIILVHAKHCGQASSQLCRSLSSGSCTSLIKT